MNAEVRMANYEVRIWGVEGAVRKLGNRNF